MTKIFVSYRHECSDATHAVALADRLTELGHDVFFDEKIPGGEEFDDFIRERLSACDVFVMLLSETALASRWMGAELRTVDELRQEQQGRPRIVPLVVGGRYKELRRSRKMRVGWKAILDELNAVECTDVKRDWAETMMRLESLLGVAQPLSGVPAGGLRNEPEGGQPVGNLPDPVLTTIERLLDHAREEIARRNYAAARKVLESCESLAHQPSGVAPTAYRVRLYNDLTLVLAYDRELEAALDAAQKARNLLAEYDDDELRAHNEHRLGFAHLQRREVYDSLKHLESAEQLCRDNDLTGLRGQVHDILGSAWSDLGLIELAIEYYRSSLQLKTEEDDRQGMALTHGNLGRAYRQMGKLSQAREHFEEDLQLSLGLQDQAGAMMMRSHLADLLREELRYAESLKAYENYLRRAQEDQLLQDVAFGLLGMCRVETALGLYDEAEEHLAEASEFDAPWFMPLLLRAEADLTWKRGALKEAVFLYRKTLESMAAQRSPVQSRVDALCQLGQALAALGRSEEASLRLQEAMELAQQSRLRWTLGRLRGLMAKVDELGGHAYQLPEMPFPVTTLAIRADGAFEPLERVDRLLELFKVSLKYATTIALAQYEASNHLCGRDDVDEAIATIFRHRNPSAGRWAEGLRAVVQALAGTSEKLIGQRVVDIFMQRVREHFKLRPGPQRCISTILSIRNNLSHGRRPDAADAESLVTDLDRALVVFLDSLKPIWEHRLVACQHRNGKRRWRELTGPSSILNWPVLSSSIPASAQNGEIHLYEPKHGATLCLSPWWIVRWRADPESRGDLFLFSKRTKSRMVYLNVETRDELKVPTA